MGESGTIALTNEPSLKWYLGVAPSVAGGCGGLSLARAVGLFVHVAVLVLREAHLWRHVKWCERVSDSQEQRWIEEYLLYKDISHTVKS